MLTIQQEPMDPVLKMPSISSVPLHYGNVHIEVHEVLSHPEGEGLLNFLGARILHHRPKEVDSGGRNADCPDVIDKRATQAVSARTCWKYALRTSSQSITARLLGASKGSVRIRLEVAKKGCLERLQGHRRH